MWVGTVLCTYVSRWGGSRRTERVTGGSDVGRWVRAGCVSDGGRLWRYVCKHVCRYMYIYIYIYLIGVAVKIYIHMCMCMRCKFEHLVFQVQSILMEAGSHEIMS